MNNSNKIIEKIKEENIRPIPKWYFNSKNIGVLLIFVMSVLIGAASFSVILFSIQQAEFNLIGHLDHSRIELVLGLLPFFWIITLMIFLIIAIYSFQRSRKGYKFDWPRLVGYSTAFSILLGTLCFIGGGAQWLDQTFEARLDIYESIDEKKKKVWMNPSNGYLAGSIEGLTGDALRLIDFNEDVWEISYDNAFIAPPVFLEKGEKIKLVGEVTGVNQFKAEQIRPWGGKEMQNRMKELMREKKEDQ